MVESLNFEGVSNSFTLITMKWGEVDKWGKVDRN